jgi:hypothetical protein
MTRAALPRVLTVALAAAWIAGPAAIVTGCGSTSRVRRPSALAVAQARHEYPAPAPRPERVAGGSGSAAAAARGFAEAYINWDAQTVSADMRALGKASIGQARAAVDLAAAQTASDYELRADGIANHGVVEAVARLPGRAAEYVVVTRERTTATGTTAYEGLAPAWHVALATVAEPEAGEYVISGWQPES